MRTAHLVVLAVILGLLGAARPARADEPPPADLGAYVDGVVSALMLSKGIAGVTVSVVDRDGILYERGYGIASQHEPRPVDPAVTLFRAGSISKTFTYVATMQLAGEHKIDLQADVNTYLPAALQIPDEGYGPVHVWNLMTHTAGFEDAAIPHLFRLGDTPVESLDDYLTRYRPHRVRPPGQHADYSNYSVALLGALVAHVSGKPFEQVVDERLFQPLGMTHSTFREPLPATDPRHMPDALTHDPSTPFRREHGGFKDEPYEHVAAIGPAGALSTTAHDMTRWMRMLLRGGELDGVRVLSPETFNDLVTVTFRNAPDVPGIAHGLFRYRYGRYESLEHAGATLAFMSNMVVLPEAGLGVFVSTNTDVGGELSGALPRMVFERLLPDARPAPAAPPAPDFEQTAKRFAGSYVSQRRAYTTLEKLVTFVQPATVAARKDGLAISFGDKTSLWIPEGPLTFRSKDTGARVEFLEGPEGTIVGYAAASSVADRVSGWDSAKTLGVALGGLALVCIGVLLGAWRRHGRRLGPYSRSAGWGALIAGFASATWLASLALFAAALSQLGADPFEALPSYPNTVLRASVGLAYAASLLAAGGLLLFMSTRRSSGWPRGRTLRHAFVLVVMLGATALLAHWNVLFAPYALGG
jgi:CubicO group peptidase (beta-lactamase class C family)